MSAYRSALKPAHQEAEANIYVHKEYDFHRNRECVFRIEFEEQMSIRTGFLWLFRWRVLITKFYICIIDYNGFISIFDRPDLSSSEIISRNKARFRNTESLPLNSRAYSGLDGVKRFPQKVKKAIRKRFVNPTLEVNIV